MTSEHVDVLIIGAGLSGVGAAWHLRDKCPSKTFALLEGRERMGGTWDLFRYPGVRSDTDMYTLGYKFKPWKNTQTIADGTLIREYIEETARENGITDHIRFGHKVTHASWSSEEARWTVTATRSDGQTATLTCSFLMMCSGYYSYDGGYTPEFKGRESFKGQIIHPQAWPEDLHYTGKRVVVIGSGATAVTLVPSMADKAAHITMLQRSPTYVLTMPREDRVSPLLRRFLPDKVVHHAARAAFFGAQAAVYQISKRSPELSRRLLLAGVRHQLDGKLDMKHFTPRYMPWDERLCAVPNGDMFKCIREGKVSVVTDHIERFTEQGVLLKSGQTLEADIIITATGLEMRLFGGMGIDVDGVPKAMNEALTYKGVMFADVPNLSLTVGYTNASWTLRADLVAEYVCRLLNAMDERGAQQVMARNPGAHVGVRPMLEMASGYVARAKDKLPRQGVDSPWQLPQSYRTDLKALRFDRLDDQHLRFSKRSKKTATATTESAPRAKSRPLTVN
ncbi:MAG: NAD(P)/FAD-dependent oxidoreductase [Sandaracinaceae bacterium]|jgi:monooxygenase|nr:NAD(P)/FAD-dependent oxidoreductase [Sandaracinaceae bacterium]MBK7773423.1 NAD(P)/FAD-dependent oxidoreductase [Sandaracinaceae bacterium]MBK8411270.1 NAD(P)/FAD-dependent oxidoreductase [Sandaracinaceae bacterium]MBP7682547.1 NAD(P)/FAD-dependent oxidoreductase [Deltaproteobacteria bacterium]